MNTRRVLRFEIPIDDQPHKLPSGRVVMVSENRRGFPNRVEVWVDTEEGENLARGTSQKLQVFGTGHPVPEDALWVGSCRADPLVWHVFEVV